jgi:hypothetical protein
VRTAAQKTPYGKKESKNSVTEGHRGNFLKNETNMVGSSPTFLLFSVVLCGSLRPLWNDLVV